MEIEALDKIFQQSFLISKSLCFLNKYNEDETGAILNDILESYHKEGGLGEFKGIYSITLLKNKLVKLKKEYKDKSKGHYKISTSVSLDDLIEKTRKEYIAQINLVQANIHSLESKLSTINDKKEKEDNVIKKPEVTTSPSINSIINEEVKAVYNANYLKEMEKLVDCKNQTIIELKEEIMKMTNEKQTLENESSTQKRIINEHSQTLTQMIKSKEKLKKQYNEIKEKYKKARKKIEELKYEIEDFNEEWESVDEDDE